MAYSPSEDLQRLVYARLTGDARVSDLVGGRVHDKAPSQAVHPFISFGPDDWTEDDAECIVSGEYSLQIDIWSRYNGKLECKRIADAVKRSLHGYDGNLTDNALVFMRVPAKRVLDDPDGITTHGVVTVQAVVEETP